LHQNIYYFPVTQRVEVLRHVGSFLKPAGRFLVTTWCQGRGVASALMDLCGAMMDRGGRLPTPAELEAQIREAGFAKVIRRSLIPGESFWAFVAQKG
jgi:hypothetical protein